MRPCNALPQSSAATLCSGLARHHHPSHPTTTHTLGRKSSPHHLQQQAQWQQRDFSTAENRGQKPWPKSPATPETETEKSSRRDADRGRPQFNIDSANRTIETSVGGLPVSPIMDPAFWAARQRHRTKKPAAGRAQNSLERQFRANPFGNYPTYPSLTRFTGVSLDFRF